MLGGKIDLGVYWGILEASEGILEASWGILWRLRGALGASWSATVSLGRVCIGNMLKRFWIILGRLGRISEE